MFKYTKEELRLMEKIILETGKIASKLMEQ